MIPLFAMIREAPFLVDTHVHLDCPPLSRSVEHELVQARLAGVQRFVIPGVSRQGWTAILALARSVPGAFAAPGLHPAEASQWSEEAAADLASLLTDPTVVAVGEIGLDSLLAETPAPVQEGAFRGQLRLAVAAGLPVLIHCRRATARLLRILQEEGAAAVGGIFHAFSGSPETALAAVEMGFAIGFGGTLTFPEARRAPEVLKKIPPAWIVLETDAPDLAPHPHRGETNRPAYLPLVVRKAAEILGWSEEEVARVTTANAERVLKMPPDRGHR